MQYEVEDPKQVFNILLRQNYRNLLKSEMFIFTRGSFMEKVGYETENEIVESILQGLEVTNNCFESHEEYGNSIHNLIKSMAKETNEKDGEIEDYQWTYGKEEYVETFKKTRGATTCGASGLHMSHWKPAVESDILANTHAFFIWAAFKLGFHIQDGKHPGIVCY